MPQMESEGLAVLEVQRLDINHAGLLRLKLFQKAGKLLLQGLEVRQSTEVSLCIPQQILNITEICACPLSCTFCMRQC